MRAGQEVNGMVLLSIRRPIYGGKVRMALHGKEETSIQAKITGSNDSFHSERSLISVYQTLREFSPYQKLGKGVYKLPFRIELPEYIPSSQQFRIGRKKILNGFRIRYRLHASLGRIESWASFNVLSSPLQGDPVPCMVQPKSFPVNALKLIKKGEVTLGASIADTNIGRGEMIVLSLACRNDSTVEIGRVAIRLIENAEWLIEAQGITREFSRTLVHMKDVELPSLSRHKKERSEVRRLLKDSSKREATQQSIYNDLVCGVNRIGVYVPEDSRDSYDGQIVHISHALVVNLQTKGICSNASIEIPVRIGSPRSPSETHNNTNSSPLDQERVYEHTDMSENHIPVAEATQVHISEDQDDDVQSVIVLGSDAVLPVQSTLEDLEPIAPPFSDQISLPNLLQRMNASTSHCSFVSSLLLEPAWVRFFCGMSVQDYASIIRNCAPPVDQPRMASLLAEYINGGDALICEWAVAAVQATNQYYRTTTLLRVLPLCLDLARNHALIWGELNVWEQTVIESDFSIALTRARSHLISS